MAEASETITAVEIHDLDERGVLAFDLADLLAVLPVAAQSDWIVTDYHPVFEDYSDETAVLAGSVQEARESGEPGVRVTGTELVVLAAKADQTIDGEFVALPPAAPTSGYAPGYAGFAASPALAIIRAVDSSYWVVVTKSPEDVAAIRRSFRDIRDSDAVLELG